MNNMNEGSIFVEDTKIHFFVLLQIHNNERLLVQTSIYRSFFVESFRSLAKK